MLVLSRKKNEVIVINDDITITVVEIRGDKVRLGVNAPKETPVHRQEVYEAIRRKQAKAEEEARAKKAEAKIVADKKSNDTTEATEAKTENETTSEVNTFNESNFDTLYAERKFFEANPTMNEHRDTLNSYVAKGLSHEQAKTLLEQEDPTINNRKTTKQSNFTN